MKTLTHIGWTYQPRTPSLLPKRSDAIVWVTCVFMQGAQPAERMLSD